MHIIKVVLGRRKLEDSWSAEEWKIERIHKDKHVYIIKRGEDSELTEFKTDS